MTQIQLKLDGASQEVAAALPLDYETLYGIHRYLKQQTGLRDGALRVSGIDGVRSRWLRRSVSGVELADGEDFLRAVIEHGSMPGDWNEELSLWMIGTRAGTALISGENCLDMINDLGRMDQSWSEKEREKMQGIVSALRQKRLREVYFWAQNLDRATLIRHSGEEDLRRKLELAGVENPDPEWRGQMPSSIDREPVVLLDKSIVRQYLPVRPAILEVDARLEDGTATPLLFPDPGEEGPLPEGIEKQRLEILSLGSGLAALRGLLQAEPYERYRDLEIVADALASSRGRERDLLLAILEADRPQSMRDCAEILQSSYKYSIAPKEITTAAEYGKYALDPMKQSNEARKHLPYEAIGEVLLAQENVRCTSHGILQRKEWDHEAAPMAQTM